jgi:hypothetical protein
MSQKLKVVSAVPVESSNHIPYNTVIIPDNDNKLIECVSHSYSVKVISCIQIFFNVLTFFSNPYLLFQVLFSICGYYGAKKYNKCLSYVYFGHTVLSCISEIFLLYFVNTQDFPTYESRIFTNITFVLILLCNIYITKIIYRFLKSLNNLDIEELDKVRQGTLEFRPVFVY